jgi:methyltransferase (TIGR00027 family)
MEENQASTMALMAAYIRGYHAEHDAPKVFDDFLANRLLTEEERASFDRQMIETVRRFNPASAEAFPDQAAILAWVMQGMGAPPIILSRGRYTEDSLEEAIRQGVKQYVILGAGLDTFAFRYPELLEQLQVFEVDHPATQAFKRRRLAELGWDIPAQLHFIPLDFTKESLAEALMRSSYDPQALTLFSWLGVTYYLPREAGLATLRAIAGIAPAGSKVIFDYYDTDAYIPQKASPRVQVGLKVVQQLGEPMKAGFDPLTLAADLAPLCLRLHEDLSPWDIQFRYFMGRTDHYHALEHAHIACAVVE